MRHAILFDLDGTLIDSIGLLLECVDYAFHDRIVRPSHKEWIAGIGTPLRTQLRQWARDEEDIGLLTQKFRGFQNLHLERLTSTFPGIKELLSEIHSDGHALGLVTSKGKEMTLRSLQHVGIQQLFQTIVTVDRTTRHKPEPEPVQLALSELGIAPELALFAGDSPHDINSGNAAGVTTIACLWGPFSTAELEPAAPGRIAHDVAELRSLIADIVGSTQR